MNNILITGGAGFVGFYLAKHFLELEHKVTIVDNFTRENNDKYFKNLIKHKNCKFLKLNMEQKESFEQIEKNSYNEIYNLYK